MYCKAPGQMQFDLFAEQRKERFDIASAEHVTRWLIEAHKCTEAVKPYVVGLYAEFEASEAFERCKVLSSLDGVHCVRGWCLQDAIDYYQINSRALDYHVIWDRAQAARSGMAKDDVLAVVGWDYGKHVPIFKGA